MNPCAVAACQSPIPVRRGIAVVFLCSCLWTMALCRMAPAQSPAAAEASPPAAAAAGGTAVAAADGLLAQARTALDRHDYYVAVQAYRKAAGLAGKTPEQLAQLGRLRRQLGEIGIDAALLNLPSDASPPALKRLPEVVDAPATSAAGAVQRQPVKADALRLVALGRAALDRGQIEQALRYARQAEAMKIPEGEFAPGEPRVWQLVLDAESAARRRGLALPGAVESNPAGAVQPAVATADDTPRQAIAQTLHTTDPASRSTIGQIQQVQDIQPIPASETGPTKGQQLFYAGLESLSRGDKATAREQFKQAWQYESELNPAERSQLKDKLTLLQPTRLGGNPQDTAPELTPIQQAELEAQQQTRRLYREITAELAKAEELKASAPLAALDQLNRLGRRVEQSNIDQQAKYSLAKMVDRAITEQKQYVEANRAQIDLDLRNEAIRLERETEQVRQSQIDEELKTLVDSFNKLMREQRFAEAEVVAKQVKELSPEHPVAVQLKHIQRTRSRIAMDEQIREQKEIGFLDAMVDVSRSGIPHDPERPLTFGDARDWQTLSELRSGGGEEYSNLSAAERKIRQQLETPVSIKFTNRPLGEVLNDLSAMTGVPIVIDHRALSEVRVDAETPISMRPLENIRLNSALNLILEQLDLTHVIDNDVLEVTSLESKRSRVYPVTYPVKDLVIPIPNFTSSYDDGLAGALRAAYQMTNTQADVQLMPVSAVDMGNPMARNGGAAYLGNDVLGQYNPMGGGGGYRAAGSRGLGGAGGGAFADFDSLIALIETTVAPETWETLGGPSTMQPYPQNLSLVISTTSEVHDQVVELLESLRRLQNLQITIEVRFITLADSFAEQIGVDFDVQFDDNVTALPDDDSGPSVAIGFDGIAGLPTGDLDIRFENGSFGLAPPFGSGGLGTPSTIGFAILSDIEAFFFLQAAQADNRSNIMQAPKVTMFDGQLASIQDQTQRPFVTSIIPVVGDFAVAQQPVIVVLNEGTQLDVQGIVSPDKRYVRLTLVPFFSQIGDVDTFTFEGRRTSRNSSRATTDTDGDGDIDEDDIIEEDEEEEIVEGTTVQLPTFAVTTVQTTVSVPDGGTILLGGIKRLAEGRVERGVPVLSKIPYVSRLFRNVSAGRDARSLMLMVTPRIIIQEEEELAQTGFEPENR